MRRREFILGAGAVAVVAGASAGIGTAQRHSRVAMPPGAVSLTRFRAACTACGLCISSCPEHVLAPAGLLDYGLSGAMMPKLDFARGACDPSCARCAEACPASALLRFRPAKRARVRIGVAEWTRASCKTTAGEACTLCSERCPCQAISLVTDGGGAVAHPKVDPSACIGCGRCENYCPAERKAIRVRASDPQGFAFGADTIVAYLADGAEWSSRARGVKPLLDAIDQGPGRFAKARCHDRVVGRAAAFLYAKLGVASVFAPVMSAGAISILKRHGIGWRFETEVPSIRNRTNDGPCPMDSSVKDFSDDQTDEAIAEIRITQARLVTRGQETRP